jgi:hypothetical protein
MLSEQAAAALERYRTAMSETDTSVIRPLCSIADDICTMAEELSRLYPPGWNEPVTVEGLERCGWKGVDYWLVIGRVRWWPYSPHEFQYDYETVAEPFKPRNMLEVWQLMQRCGLPSPLDRKDGE